MFFFNFITKDINTNAFFSVLCISLTLTGNFKPLQSSFLAKPLSAFVPLAGLRSAGLKYMTKHYLKLSLSSIF